MNAAVTRHPTDRFAVIRRNNAKHILGGAAISDGWDEDSKARAQRFRDLGYHVTETSAPTPADEPTQ